ncbi:SGNH/GDSL hydrolase family protein [Dyadobacter luticola]|uniref:SGNH/GDSL hydrolase family protein n=1 Tax=Dyadobacter luticola TaxID=1979387 RepID=UPI00197A7438|nr:SGNH/GDSL hydrolase family protein [Dyadobacter luticola]
MKDRRDFLRSAVAGTALTALFSENGFAETAGTHISKPADGITILFQGDSITDGNRTRNTDWNHVMGHGFAYIIASKLWYDYPEKGLHFLNRGVSGNRITHLAERWQTDTIEMQPDFLNILVGINDTEAAIKGDTSCTPEQFEKDYRTLLKLTKEKLPKVKLILCEPFILPVGRVKEKLETYRSELEKRQSIVKKLSEEFGAVHVPFQSAFDAALSRAPADYWIWDGIHPMPAGHELMARFWLEKVGPALGLSPQAATAFPDPLLFNNGQKLTSAKQWPARREEILQIMTTEMYGTSPGKPKNMRFEVFDNDRKALGGKATRKQVTIHIKEKDREASFDLLIYIPNKVKHPVPAIMGINFVGNQAVIADPGIKLTRAWVENSKMFPCGKDGKATEGCRGVNASQWAVEEILDQGYALVTMYREEIASDRKEEMFKTGVHALYPEYQDREDNFSTMAAWAWALSRGMDYLETDKDIDRKKVAVFGFSRLGKAALWAGATDQRFAMVLSNESGAGGGKQFRRHIGEDIQRLCTVFPHWYAKSFRKYMGKDKELPFDQHFVMALIAPRPVYLATAEEDRNADPRGEFETAKASDATYKFLGTKGFEGTTFPALNQPVYGQIGFHIRPGGHDVTNFDWIQFLNFSNLHFGK